MDVGGRNRSGGDSCSNSGGGASSNSGGGGVLEAGLQSFLLRSNNRSSSSNSSGSSGSICSSNGSSSDWAGDSGVDTSDGIWDAGLVVPGLYVGSLRAACDSANLQKHGVTHIFTAAGKFVGRQVSVPENIRHFQIDIADNPNADLFLHMEASLNFMDNALSHNSISNNSGEKVDSNPAASKSVLLVHCASGVSRSVSYCCAWLMIRRGMTLSDALTCVRLNRPLASPNIGFKSQLQTLQDSNGDIFGAKTLYAQRVASRSISSVIFEQREASNAIHARVEEIEVQIQQHFADQKVNASVDGSRNNDLMQTHLAELLKLQQQLEDSVYALADGPATIIRKSASQKVSHLIGELQKYK